MSDVIDLVFSSDDESEQPLAVASAGKRTVAASYFLGNVPDKADCSEEGKLVCGRQQGHALTIQTETKVSRQVAEVSSIRSSVHLAQPPHRLDTVPPWGGPISALNQCSLSIRCASPS